MGVTTVLADDMPLDPRREISARLERLDGQLARMLRVGAEDAMLNDLNMIQHEIATLRLIFNSPWDNDKRRDLRMPSSIATIATVRGAEADCVVEDMSVGGALVHLDVEGIVSATRVLKIDIYSEVSHCIHLLAFGFGVSGLGCSPSFPSPKMGPMPRSLGRARRFSTDFASPSLPTDSAVMSCPKSKPCWP